MYPLIFRRLNLLTNFGNIYYKLGEALSNREAFSKLGITHNNMETVFAVNALVFRSLHFKSVTQILEWI